MEIKPINVFVRRGLIPNMELARLGLELYRIFGGELYTILVSSLRNEL